MKIQNNSSESGISVSVDHLYPVLPVIGEAQQRITMCVTLLPQESHQEEKPVDVLCIIDVSASMQLGCGVGDNISRLEACAGALQNIVRDLRSCDRIGCIAFSDKVVSSSNGFVALSSAQNVEMVEKYLRSLRIDGGTRFAPAFSHAQEILCEENATEDLSRRRQIVVLVTDGDSKYEETDCDARRAFADFLRERSIAFIAIGTGVDYKSVPLYEMAARVGGNSSAPHAQNMSEIEGYLQSEICYAKGAQISGVVIDVRTTRRSVFLREVVLLSHGCKALKVNDSRSCEVNTGWLGHLRGQQLLISFDVANIPSGVHEIAKITLRFRSGMNAYEVQQMHFLTVECDAGFRDFGPENPLVWKKQRMALGFSMLRNNQIEIAKQLFSGVGSETMFRMLDGLSRMQGRLTELREDIASMQKLRSTITMTSSATCFGTLDALPVADAQYDPNVVASEVLAYRENAKVFWRTTCLKCGEGYPRGKLHCDRCEELLFQLLPEPREHNELTVPILKILPTKNLDRVLSVNERDRLAVFLTGQDFEKHCGQLFVGRPDLAQDYSPTIDISAIAGNAVSRQQALLCYDRSERKFSLQMLSANIPMYFRRSGEVYARLLERHGWLTLRNADVLIVGNPKGAHATFRVLFL